MINYNRSAFGINLLGRLHGSAIYRSCVPGLLSALILLLIRAVSNGFGEDWAVSYNDRDQNLGHPYLIGVVVTGTTFLIVFRASQGYSRYWEAVSSVYQMMSKWLDSSIHIGVYHLQSDHYNPIKPPSFNDVHELNREFFTRDRERVRHDHHHSLEDLGGGSNTPSRTARMQRAQARSINAVSDEMGSSSNHGKGSKKSLLPTLSKRSSPAEKSLGSENADALKKKYATTRVVTPMSTRDLDRDSHNPRPLLGRARLDGNWGPLFDDTKSTFHSRLSPDEPFTSGKGFASTCGGRTPPLFLQELAHLTSLMNAVALSTLRNDVDGAESPLDLYEPGKPWPAVDPTYDPVMWGGDHLISKLSRSFMYFLGYGRTPEERTKYNAKRPLPVLGGVSDGEIRFLQLARGPLAKTQLCWAWLSEFITREHLAGSTGKVAPPIISRTIQFLSDGMTSYNHARKIMFIPFPFVHAQLSAAFVLVMIPTIPYLMDQYTEDLWLGTVLSFLTVMCLSGIHEVARELENPFRNIPNELPVVTMQAEFNEALLTMYAGYHPDFFWDPQELGSFRTSVSMAPIPIGQKRHSSARHADTPPKRQTQETFPMTSPFSPIPKKRQHDILSPPLSIARSCRRSQALSLSSISEKESEMDKNEDFADDEMMEFFDEDTDVSFKDGTENPMVNATIDIKTPPPPPPLLDGLGTSRVSNINGLEDQDGLPSHPRLEVVEAEEEIRTQATQFVKRPNSNKKDADVDRLKLIVEQQATMMERMIEEQSRMNKMMVLLLQSKNGDSEKKG